MSNKKLPRCKHCGLARKWHRPGSVANCPILSRNSGLYSPRPENIFETKEAK